MCWRSSSIGPSPRWYVQAFRRASALGLALTGFGMMQLAAVAIAVGPLVAQARGLATMTPAVADRLRAALVGRFGSVFDGTALITSSKTRCRTAPARWPGGIYGAAGVWNDPVRAAGSG